jgi:L-ascorbate metabolism protein UlaG (beta-lactamase superfamily)
MQVEWFGQSAFRLEDGGTVVVIDPFGAMDGLGARGLEFNYPPIEDVSADLLLVTHEHGDHNGVEAIDGDPVVLRSTAGTHESPVGEVIGIASEHDQAAGTERGPNTFFVFTLGDVRVAHLGDLGQASLREEQAAALGKVDLLFVPVGGGPTIGAGEAAEIARQVQARWIVPMHYRTERVNFLETAEEFLAIFDGVERLDTSAFELEGLPDGEAPLVVVPAAP